MATRWRKVCVAVAVVAAFTGMASDAEAKRKRPVEEQPATVEPEISAAACTGSASFLGVVHDVEDPAKPRQDFAADEENFRTFLAALGQTTCISGSRLLFRGAATEAAVKAAIAELDASAPAGSTFFYFHSSHGAPWSGAVPPSACPPTRLAGSYANLGGPGDGSENAGDFDDCELGAALNAQTNHTRAVVMVDCSFCGGFSDSVTAVSGTIPDGSVPTSAGVVAPNRIVITGCAITTECFGDAEEGAGSVMYSRMVRAIENPAELCDGWTGPGFPDLQGIDLPQRSDTDGACKTSELFWGAVNLAYEDLDPIAIQQQFRIKYGFDDLASDIPFASA